MNEHLFDNHVKATLSNYESAVPVGLWNKIAEENRKKPSIIWWQHKKFYVGILLLFISSTFCFLIYSNIDNQNGVDEKLYNNNKQEARKEKLNIANDIEEANLKTNSDGNETKKTITINTTPENNTQSKYLNNSEQLSNNVKGIKQNNFVLNKKVAASNYSNRNKQIVAEKENDNNSSILNKKLNSTSNIPFNYDAFTKGSLTNIQLKNLGIYLPTMPNLKVNLFKPKDCPSVNEDRRNDWYLESFIAPEYIIKNTKSTVASNAYLAKKDSIESMQGGFTIGARLNKNITENILLKAGVQFSQINEKTSLRRENERRVITVVTIKTITDAGGNVITVSDTSTVIQVGYAITTGYNYYRNIELPVTLSYEMGNKKFRTAINGGLIVNLASWYKGKVLDTAYQLVNVNPKENDGITKHTVGLSLYGSISLIQTLNKTLDIFAEPFFRYNLTKLENTAYGFNQRFGALGISIGLRYKLNNNRQRY